MARIRHEWIPQIRKMHAAGATVEALARYFGVSVSAIRYALVNEQPRRHCPTCGRLMPCVACAAELWFTSQLLGHRPADSDAKPVRLGINLHGATLNRYLSVRAEKIRTRQA